MSNGLHIYDLGIERYVDIRREAEHIGLIRKAKKGSNIFFQLLPRIRHLLGAS